MNEPQSTEKKELYAALALAQSKFKNASCSGGNAAYNSKYAKVSDLLTAVFPVLGEHGLSIQSGAETGEDGNSYAFLKICHSSGQSEERRIKINGLEDKQKIPVQAFQSTTTYLVRGLLKNMLGINAPEDEDDGNSLVNAIQVEEIYLLMNGDTAIRDEVLKAGKIKNISDILAHKYDTVIKLIEHKKEERK